MNATTQTRTRRHGHTHSTHTHSHTQTHTALTHFHTRVCSSFDAEDAAAPLLYTDEAKDSYFLCSLPKDVRKSLQDSPIAMENHGKGGVFMPVGLKVDIA
jgi:hypothetical protein